jgi:hypothetical protein
LSRANIELSGAVAYAVSYKKFDSKIWQNASTGNDRQGMLKDLVKNVLPEKTKAQVKEILGADCYEMGNNLYCATGNSRILLSHGVEQLVIYFDADNVYEKYEIIQSGM